jgi:thiol-disulfide isomerase/thioredoxin
VVLLDFWTLGCINCLQAIPTLRAIETEFADRVAVIGVHTPKFDAEKNPDAVADAIRRYGVTHPVLHDPSMEVWSRYAVRAWPTLVVVSPGGRVLGQVSGEPDLGRLRALVRELLHRPGPAIPQSLRLTPIADPVPPGRFRYPGKLKPLPGRIKKWVLADSGHNQIVVLDENGAELQRYGSGEAGWEDGWAAEAKFRDPQGLAADESFIWVADTGNHAIRRVHRADGLVETVAGTGVRGPLLPLEPTRGAATPLASPWDVARVGDALIFANAGTHQLGQVDVTNGKVVHWFGSGREGLLDGSPDQAAMAQPSGLALSEDGKMLWVADAESSALRAVSLGDVPVLTTWIGAGLFEWGTSTGALRESRLQHPLGVAAGANDQVWIADSYNNTLRQVEPAKRQSHAIGEAGWTCVDPICVPLRQPAGLWPDGDAGLLVVDTNNHRIERYDLASKTMRCWAR